ncbi:MAG: AAA family ATPase, partial [Elusimicrobiota bacterium]
MISIRCSRAAKSGIAVAVSFALFLTSAGWPASQAFAQALTAARAAEGGVRIVVLPDASISNGVPVPGFAPGPAALTPSFGAASSASAPRAAGIPAPAAPASPAALAAPAGIPFSAASAPAEAPTDARASAGAPAASPTAPATPAGTLAAAAPRSSPDGGVRAWLGQRLSRLAGAGAAQSRREFDGEALSGRSEGSAAFAASARPAASDGLRESASGRRSSAAIRAIVDDMRIPTPEAAKRVGAIRHEHGTPLWAKIVAPLAVAAAGVAAVHFGAVGVLTLAAGLVLSVLAHEIAHVAVLHALGDRTAEQAGTHSLNPFSHIDAVKTVIMPAVSLGLSSAILPFPVLIGSAKPVDADFNNLRGPFGGPRSARNAFWVAAAGPLTNFALAGLALAAAAFLPAGGILAGAALALAHMNAALGVFNLLPLPQLDGGKMLASVLPEAWYAKWVYNPKIEKGYQGLFRRFYEGPTNVLTFIGDKLGVKDQRTLNRVANGVTFAALSAFYAVAYFHFSVKLPLMFLALPCTYDYWCIREKVRSEAAVKDVMDIFSVWSSVIAQIAEDRGMASEVSLFETEHAMKNALETLIDEMMAKEDFRALSDEEKLAAVMAAYPDKAAEFLKDKVFTEGADTKEKILELLKDSRNAPFYERLTKWFKDHDIFKRWDNPKYEGKLRDQLKEADKPKSRSQGGFATVGLMSVMAVVGAGALLFPGLAHHLPALAAGGLGLLGLAGTLAPHQGDLIAKLRPRPGDVSHNVHVRFVPGTTAEVVRNITARFPGATALGAGSIIVYRLPATSVAEGVEIVSSLVTNTAVETVSVPADLFLRLTSDQDAEPEPANSSQMSLPGMDAPAAGAENSSLAAQAVETDTRDSAGKITTGSVEEKEVRVALASDSSAALRAAIKDEIQGNADVLSAAFVENGVISFVARTVERAAVLARALARRKVVDAVFVSPAAQAAPSSAGSEVQPETTPEAAPAPASVPEASASEEPREPSVDYLAKQKDSRDWTKKISAAPAEGDGSVGEKEFRVALAEGLSEELRTKIRNDIHGSDNVTSAAYGAGGILIVIARYTVPDAAKMARAIAELKAVDSVVASAAVRDQLFSVPLPAKLALHGKEHWSTGAVLVKFTGDTPESLIKEVLERHGQKTIFRLGEFYVVDAGNASQAAVKAVGLAKEEAVAAVEIHANVAAALENRSLVPYPAAESYDPAQSVLVQFKADATPEQMRAYADARRLRLVYKDFRGGEKLALLEIPHGPAAPSHTAFDVGLFDNAGAMRRMLADESLDEGSLVTDVKPFKDQPGEAPLAPSAEAKARAEARKAAAAAAEESKHRKPRRDVAAEWISYLQNRKLSDGTTLTDGQVKALAQFLKPVAKGLGEQRPPVVGRGEEIKRMLPIVTSPRGMRNSVILVGGAGTGKTAIPEGMAEMIEDAEHASANDSEQFLQFQRLKGRWLVELDINAILSLDEPAKKIGALNAILNLLPRLNDANPGRGNEVIVLMDEIQKFFLDGAGQQIANLLKGPLRDGRISVIATTTTEEYKKFIESDDAFRRRFEKIDVAEPNVAATTRILRAMKGWLQKIHSAVVPDEVLVAAAKLTDQFDKTNFNPDKSIKAVQDGAELSRPENLRAAVTLDIRENWNELAVAANQARQLLLDKGIASTLALPVEMYNTIAGLIKKGQALYAEREAIVDGEGRLTVDVVKRVIAQKTGIASGQLNLGEDDASRYNEMEKTIGERVVNQEPALTAIANAIRRNKAGLSNPSRPMGKFLLTGPTGVGKTWLAKMLAWFLFKDPNAMIRIDMSEYMEEHTTQRLTGAPPGYVGYEEGGQLTEQVRKKPYSVILFDEIEKAHPKVFNVLLQILDDGRLTDGKGRTVDFKNTVILMTSNAGMDPTKGGVDGEKYAKLLDAIEAHNASVEEKAVQSLAVEKAWDDEIDATVAETLKANFKPEFLNRLDEDPRSKNKWIRVNRLRAQDMKKIAEIQVGEFKGLLADRHDTDLVIDPSVIEYLSKEGFSHLYGARPMTAAIEKHIIDPMAKWILEEAANGRQSVRGGQITVSYEGGKIVFKAEVKPLKDTPRASLQDASAAMAAEVFSLIERLAGDGDGEEPSEGLFDKLLRASGPAAEKPAPAEAAPAPRAFFAPDAALPMPPGARGAAAAHNRAKAADPAARAVIKSVAEAVAAAGWPASVSEALAVPAGQAGEGWFKQVTAFAKDRAEKAGVSSPIEFVSAVDGDRVRVLVHSDAALTDADKAFLAAHFTGAPPASYEAAQQFVDGLAPTSSFVRNHNLLDLYRRVRSIPGARMGYASGASARGGKGSDVWLEVRKEAPQPAETAAAAAPSAPAAATPHQVREADKTRALMMRFIDQSRISATDRDGTAIQVAAAESYARLATPADAELAREWIANNKWAVPGSGQITITAKKALAMTAALVLQRFGGVEDIPRIEAMTAKLKDYSHYEVPLHNAFVAALAALYSQAGIAEVRAAAARGAVLKDKSGDDTNHKDILEATARALGRLGYPSDLEEAKEDSAGLAELYRRMGKADELRAVFYDNDKWRKLASPAKMATFALVAEVPPTEKTFGLLAESMKGARSSDRVARYHAAQAWANLVARGRRTKGLAAAMA